MKAIWKGYLKCSLVTIPLKMYNTIAKSSRQFHLYHQFIGRPVAAAIWRTLSRKEVVRGRWTPSGPGAGPHRC